MAIAHEEDVVIAFRQAVEEELKRAQEGDGPHEQLRLDASTTEENLQRLAESHAILQREVALLRTIILKLVSQPVDETKANPPA